MDLNELSDDFKERAEYSSVDFKTEEGEQRTDSSVTFDLISTVFQDRGYIYKEELLEVGRWKVGGKRLDRHIKDNSKTTVKEQSEEAFAAADDTTPIAALSELKGVRVPVASSILAMWKPEKHAVIDFRALRALPAAKPDLLDLSDYEVLAEFLEQFRSYGSDPEVYAFYVEQIRELADQHGLLAREVDMALWEFDRQRTDG